MIDIRKGKYAKSGLDDMCKYLKGHIDMNKMVEIGCFVGNSTSIFVQHFSKIFCVDPWVTGWDSHDGSSFYNMAEVQRQFDTQVYVPNEDIITKHKMTSKEANSLFEDESLDFVYHLDGMEHIPKEVEDLAITEMMRVSKKYVVFMIGMFPSIEDPIMKENNLEELHINIKNAIQWKETINSLIGEKFKFKHFEEYTKHCLVIIERVREG